MLVTTKHLNRLAPLYEASRDTLVWSVLDGSMGWAFVDNIEAPACAVLTVGDFLFPAGDAGARGAKTLLRQAQKPLADRICAFVVPPDEPWKNRVLEVFGSEGTVDFLRYSTGKDTVFDREKLAAIAGSLPEGYRVSPIDDALYSRCLEDPLVYDFCSNFLSAEDFAARGIGYCVLYGDMIVGGASSYTVYKGGIEIETDTHPKHRRKGIASAASAKLILACLDRGLYPSWDAATRHSLALAQKLGYAPAGPYCTLAVATAAP